MAQSVRSEVMGPWGLVDRLTSCLVKLLLICNGSKSWSGNTIPRSFAPSRLHQCGQRRTDLALTPKLSLPSSSCDGHVQLKVGERKGERYGTGVPSDTEHRGLTNQTSLNAVLRTTKSNQTTQLDRGSIARNKINICSPRPYFSRSLIRCATSKRQ